MYGGTGSALKSDSACSLSLDATTNYSCLLCLPGRVQEPNNRHVLQSPYFWGGVCYQAATMGISMYGAECAIKFFM